MDLNDFLDALEDDQPIVAQTVRTFGELLSANWPQIRAESENNEAGGKVRVGASITLDFTGKVPAGALNLRVMRKSVKDDAAIYIEDPDQAKLPIGGADDKRRVKTMPLRSARVAQDGIEPGSTMSAG